MKTRTIALLKAVAFPVVVISMVIEWKIAVWMGASSAIHNYHGICNQYVGRPYEDFVRQLHTIAQSGDTNKLLRVLCRADERSRDIYDVWLGYDLPSEHDKYRRSIDEILK